METMIDKVERQLEEEKATLEKMIEIYERENRYTELKIKAINKELQLRKEQPSQWAIPYREYRFFTEDHNFALAALKVTETFTDTGKFHHDWLTCEVVIRTRMLPGTIFYILQSIDPSSDHMEIDTLTVDGQNVRELLGED